MKKFTCCICGKEAEGYGNNPAPVKHSGQCCDTCNRDVVMPKRIELLTTSGCSIELEFLCLTNL